MELFEFTNSIFTGRDWDSISDVEKRKHAFMANRFMSIQYPLQAQALNHMRINQVAVMDFWRNFFMNKRLNKAPFWIYTKGVKKAKDKLTKEKKLNIKENLINEFSKFYSIEKKSILKAIEIFPEDMKKEFKEFENFINESSKK